MAVLLLKRKYGLASLGLALEERDFVRVGENTNILVLGKTQAAAVAITRSQINEVISLTYGLVSGVIRVSVVEHWINRRAVQPKVGSKETLTGGSLQRGRWGRAAPNEPLVLTKCGFQ